MGKFIVISLVILLLLFSVSGVQAIVIATDTQSKPVVNEPVSNNPDRPVFLVNDGDTPGINDSPGEIVGETMYDYQHNSSVGHQIAVSEDGKVHAVWMHSDNAQHQPRRVKYRYRDLDGNWGSINNVDPGPRAGYTGLDLHSDGSAVVGYHLEDAAANAQTQVAKDLIEGFGSFIQDYVDNNSVPTEQIIWPKIGIGQGDICHVLSANSTAGPEIFKNLYYSRSVSGNYQQDGFVNWDTELPVQTFQRLQLVIYGIAASKVSQKVIRAFMLAPDHEDAFQRINDVYYQISLDAGLTWSTMTNLTNYNEVVDGELEFTSVVPEPYDFYDPEVHVSDGPMDTFYWQGYPNCEVLIDDNDIAHVIWSTHMFGARNDTNYVQTFIGQIMHWDDQSQEISVVYDDVHENGDPTTYNPIWNDVDDMFDFFDRFGRFESSTCDMSMGYDQDNNLYVVFAKFFGGDYCAEIEGYGNDSNGLMYNGEIMVIGSTDAGATWGTWNDSEEFELGKAKNVTNSHTPDCMPGECDDDGYATVARKITGTDVSRTVHILYLNDDTAGAGGVNDDEGPASNVPMKYLAVPFGTVAIEDDSDEETAAVSTFIVQNRPNPFTAATTISFNLAQSSEVSLTVYNEVGQLVKTLIQDYRVSGENEVVWDGTNERNESVGAGIYLYQLKTDLGIYTNRMVLLK